MRCFGVWVGLTLLGRRAEKVLGEGVAHLMEFGFLWSRVHQLIGDTLHRRVYTAYRLGKALDSAAYMVQGSVGRIHT